MVVLIGALAETAFGYEFSTHAALTREAFMRWTTDPANVNVLDRLGLVTKKDSLGSVYIDMTAGSLERLASPKDNRDFGKRHFDSANSNLASVPPFESITGWLMLGAIREDDVPFDPGALENTPQDEPGGNFVRVYNHFYDPYFDRPLMFVIEPGSRAPDWAIPGLDKAGVHKNHFAVVDARDAMWKALTLKSFATQLLIDLPFAPTTAIPTREALRSAYWATTFRALGDVMHLLQDMAQPQHTRNDPHAGLGCKGQSCVFGHASYFENYIDARATGAGSFRLRERFSQTSDPNDIDEQVVANPLSYDGYPIVRFANYRDFFSTGTSGDSYVGSGLANYSNQGFYSAGTNILATKGYLRPPATADLLQRVVIPEGSVTNAEGKFVTKGALTLLVGLVADAAHPELPDGAAAKLSSLGAFDQYLHPSGGQYTLNHYNYDDQARLLVPRAVAYSAGLIDYFFRGKMEISLPDEGVYSILDHSKFAPPAPPTNQALNFKGFNKIRLRLKNTTDDITPPQGQAIKQEMSGGTLVAVLKFRRNLCYVDALDNEITDEAQAVACRSPTEEIVVSDALTNQSPPFRSNPEPNGPELTFVFQQELPINAWDVILQVVYRGKLGSEDDAVVVASKDISEPTFIATYNDTDYVFMGGSCYKPDAIAASDGLWNQLALACKDTSGPSRKVSDACANVPLNVRYTFGIVAKPLIVAMEFEVPFDFRVTQRHFGRIGVLGETGTQLSFTLGFHNAPLHLSGGDTEPESLGTYTVQKEKQVAGVYRTHRGVKFWDATIFVVDGTAASVGADCPEPNQDLLLNAERYPSAVTITGWN
jgi:hypothetical protein